MEDQLKDHSESLVIFGSQYYRSPLPPKRFWRGDFEEMARLGFNAIKLTPVWRWIEPETAKYDFDDLQGLMDLAAEFKFGVVINFFWDSAPAWLFREFADCRMVTAEGRPVGPAVSPSRQLGGAPGACLSHPSAMKSVCEVLAAIAKQFSAHPALLAWDVWNEPELNGAFHRHVGTGEKTGEDNDLLCYCSHCQHNFWEWLEKKYATIDRLNVAWCQRYREWEEVEIPRARGVFNPMIDWRMFFVEEMASRLSSLIAAVRSEDSEHPIMAHSVPKPDFNIVACADDEWRMAEHCDLWGNTRSPGPFGISVTRCAAAGKMVWNSEVHALPGDTLHPGHTSLTELKRHVLVPLSQGAKGFLFWQFRPELLGLEGPAWNIIRADGRATPWTAGVASLAELVVKNRSFLCDAELWPTDIGIIQFPEAEIFSWIAAGSVQIYQENLIGCHQALYDAGLSADFLHPMTMDEKSLSRYRVIYFPFPYYLPDGLADRLREWIRGGGVLIAEAGFSGIVRETGFHATTIPGEGFEEVFGAVEGVRQGIEGGLQGRVLLNTAADFLKSDSKDAVWGGSVCFPIEPGSAEVWASFSDGEPAVTHHSFGQGEAIWIGTYLGIEYYRRQTPGTRTLISGLARKFSQAIQPSVRPEGGGRVDLLTSPTRTWMVLRNLYDKAAELNIELPIPKLSHAVNLLNGERVELKGNDKKSSGSVLLGEKEIEVFELH